MTPKEILLAVADGAEVEGWDYKRGLCGNIAALLGLSCEEGEELVENCAKTWPHTSSHHTFPVPYTPEELKAVFEERHYWVRKDMPSMMYHHHALLGTLYGNSNYGKMRRDLARHLAENMQ